MSKYKLRLKRQRRRERARACSRAAAKPTTPVKQPTSLSPEMVRLILQRLDERFDKLFGSTRDGLVAGLKSNAKQ